MTPTASALDDLMQAAKHTIQKVDRLVAAEARRAVTTTFVAHIEADRAMRHALTMLQGPTDALRDAVNALEHPERPGNPETTTNTDPATGRTEA